MPVLLASFLYGGIFLVGLGGSMIVISVILGR